jgi:alpha-amylase/alpha-mannosidase (GH57 family)
VHHVVVHAHCYQPPREDPWLEVVEAEASAAPDHDWNARIDRECYARLAACEARLRDADATNDPDARAGVARLINLYAWCTFDVGATLCEWMETEAPATLRAMIDGDAASVRRWGHGNAIAAPYHHVILPLASPRDRRTEVRWGIADFQRRFGRLPEGMWLPECAADEDTLDLLAEEGIRFTILAPYQVRTGAETHGLPVRWRGASGRTLTILPYDGGLAGEVAFGGLLRDPAALAGRLAPSIDDGQDRCTTLATDGETFGHHHRNGDRTLALAMAAIAARSNAKITNAAALVASVPATLNAELVSPSAWSCAHGVERWRSNCGCRLDHHKAPAQQWRGPLRAALRGLAEQSGAAFEREGATLFRDDPWTVRDAYGAFVSTEGAPLEAFARSVVRPDTDDAGVQRARELLEMQRATLRLFTSCAWFFDDVDRIETRQVLRYAARVLELSGLAGRLEPEFVHWLEAAHAPGARSVSASEVFVRGALPHRQSAWNVAAGAIALVASGLPCTRVAVFDVVVTPPPADTAPYGVAMVHRRTGQRIQLEGVVTGAGPALTVRINEPGADAAHARVVPLRDFPESVALELLRPLALDDAALLG